MSTEIESADDDAISRYVWKRIGKESARDMAKALGVSPDEILRVKRDLAESVDALTVDVQRAKLLRSLQELADDAHERAQNVADERNYAGIVNAAAGAIDKLLKELRRTGVENSDAVNSLNQLRINELLHLIDVTVARTLEDIAIEHDLDESELLGIFQRHLKPAAEELDK